jgi:aldehyde dehydrogenase (NAD+)
VAAAAAKNLTPCILELGGKCPMIVDKSADLDYAAAKVATMSFLNAGQFCIRADYCLVETSLMNSFVQKLQENLEAMYK